MRIFNFVLNALAVPLNIYGNAVWFPDYSAFFYFLAGVCFQAALVSIFAPRAFWTAPEMEIDIATAIRAAELRGRVAGVREAAKLVWEVGTGYSDRTKAIADYIESEARQLESSPTT